jgi:hypothetical protein
LNPAEKEALKRERLAERFKFESTRMRGYELIYPCSDKARNAEFEVMLNKANELWDDFTTGKKKHKE